MCIFRNDDLLPYGFAGYRLGRDSSVFSHMTIGQLVMRHWMMDFFHRGNAMMIGQFLRRVTMQAEDHVIVRRPSRSVDIQRIGRGFGFWGYW